MGLSQADRQVLGIFAMAAGCVVILRKHYKDKERTKTPLKLADRVASAAEIGMSVIAPQLDLKEAGKLNRQLREYEQRCIPDRGEITVITGALLGMLSDALDLVGNPAKRVALERCLSSVTALHKYYDRKLDRPDQEALATRAADTWKQMGEGI